MDLPFTHCPLCSNPLWKVRSFKGDNVLGYCLFMLSGEHANYPQQSHFMIHSDWKKEGYLFSIEVGIPNEYYYIEISNTFSFIDKKELRSHFSGQRVLSHKGPFDLSFINNEMGSETVEQIKNYVQNFSML